SFEIHPGDRIAVMGPSGSGKSTLIHLIAALDHPTSGSIEWPAIGPANRLRPGPVSLSFQGPSLLPPLTVVENVELPMLLAGWPDVRSDVDRGPPPPAPGPPGRSDRGSCPGRGLFGLTRFVLHRQQGAHDPAGAGGRAGRLAGAGAARSRSREGAEHRDVAAG